MAVNIPLVSEEGGGLMPARYTNEVFILRRDDMELELKDETGVLVPSLRGELHVTNVRIVFIVGEKYTRKSRFRSVEIPFRGLENEALHQPIFGANNISGTIIPYDDQPFLGTIKFKLYFKSGGVGTFLPRFNYVLGSTRRNLRQFEQRQREEQERHEEQSRMAQQSEEYSAGRSSTSPVWYGAPYDAAHFTAIVDPSDPSEIYVHQPSNNSQSRPPPDHLKMQ